MYSGRKLFTKVCDDSEQNSKSVLRDQNQNQVFIANKQHEIITGEELFVPSVYLQNLCSNIELQYRNVIDSDMSQIISHIVVNVMKNVYIPQEFKCLQWLGHTVDFIDNASVNIRLHHSLEGGGIVNLYLQKAKKKVNLLN